MNRPLLQQLRDNLPNELAKNLLYDPTTKCRCIIGQALHEIGISDEAMEMQDICLNLRCVPKINLDVLRDDPMSTLSIVYYSHELNSIVIQGNELAAMYYDLPESVIDDLQSINDRFDRQRVALFLEALLNMTDAQQDESNWSTVLL